MARRKINTESDATESPQEAVDAAVAALVVTTGEGDEAVTDWMDDKMGGFLNSLFSDAIDLRAERQDVLDRQSGNREAIRALKASGRLGADQVKLVDALYPVVIRKPKEATTDATAAAAVLAANTPAENAEARKDSAAKQKAAPAAKTAA